MVLATLDWAVILGYLTLILGIGFRVFCAYTTPSDVVGCWIPHKFGEPIRIGEVIIRLGDWAVGDRDGVVIIPGDIIEEVVDETERVMRTESKVRTAILDGMNPKDAYLKYGKF